MARSTARKRALNTLYEADEKGQDILSLLSERLENPGAQTPLPDYAVDIVRGIAEHRRHLDGVLNAHSETWQVRRMPVVDRNILRIGAWELIYNEEIPQGVAIDEAIQLAKKLSDYDAPAFIHGVLSAISDDAEVGPEVVAAETDDVEKTEASDAESAETLAATEETAESAPVEAEAAVSEAEPADASVSTEAATESIASTTAEPVVPESAERNEDTQDLADLDLSQFAVAEESTDTPQNGAE